MPIGSVIRTNSRVERAVRLYFYGVGKELNLKKSDVYRFFKGAVTDFYQKNKKSYPNCNLNNLKESNITRFDRPIRQEFIPLLDDFFNYTTEDNFRFITNDDFIKIPYTDKEMKGLKEGVFRAMRHSTTQHKLSEVGQESNGRISISWMKIWKEPHESSDKCHYWRYQQQKIDTKTSKMLRAEGVIIKNYDQFLFVAAEQYFPIDDEGNKVISNKTDLDAGTQLMHITADNDSDSLRGILLSVTNFGHIPCATRVYIKSDPDMVIEDSGVENNSDELSIYLDNDINPVWNMLLPVEHI